MGKHGVVAIVAIVGLLASGARCFSNFGPVEKPSRSSNSIGDVSTAWLQQRLTSTLKDWISAVDNRYDEQSLYEEREDGYSKATSRRDGFASERRAQFIREAADL